MSFPRKGESHFDKDKIMLKKQYCIMIWSSSLAKGKHESQSSFCYTKWQKSYFINTGMASLC